MIEFRKMSILLKGTVDRTEKFLITFKSIIIMDNDSGSYYLKYALRKVA